MENLLVTGDTVKITVTLSDGTEFKFDAIQMSLTTNVDTIDVSVFDGPKVLLPGAISSDLSFRIQGTIDMYEGSKSGQSKPRKRKEVTPQEMKKKFTREIEF